MTGLARETLDLWREGISPSLSLLIPTFAFPHAPVKLTLRLQRRVECSPTDTYVSHSFGKTLNARLLSTPNSSTSELLRTL